MRGRRRRRELEKYLQKTKESDMRGQRSVALGRRTTVHLMGHLAMTEAEVLEAAFNSANIKATPGTDQKTGRADVLYFEYVEARGKPYP